MKTEELEVEEEVLSKVDLVQRSGSEERENSSSGREVEVDMKDMDAKEKKKIKTIKRIGGGDWK